MLPKYEIIKQDLLAAIKRHDFTPGEKFYTEAEVKKIYSVSSITAVKALNELTSAGYLYRIQGKGTYVSKSKVSKNVKFSDLEINSHDKDTIEVLSIVEDNKKEILDELGLSPKDTYLAIERLRYSNGIPFILQHSFLSNKIAQNINFVQEKEFESVYNKIKKDLGIDLYSMASIETNEIIFLDESRYLNLLKLSFREPVVKQIKHTYLPDKTVAEYVVSYKHWKYFKTKIEVEAD